MTDDDGPRYWTDDWVVPIKVEHMVLEAGLVDEERGGIIAYGPAENIYHIAMELNALELMRKAASATQD